MRSATLRKMLTLVATFAMIVVALPAHAQHLAHLDWIVQLGVPHGVVLGPTGILLGSNSLGNYNETFFAQEALIWLEKSLGMAGRIYRGYDPTPKAQGNTIQLRRPTQFTAANAPAAATDLNPDSVSITLNQWKEVKMVLTDMEMSLSRDKIIDDHIRPMAYAIADAIDQSCAGLTLQVPWISSLTSASAPLLSDITAARLIQFNNKVPIRDGPAFMHAMVNGNLEAGILNKLTATTGAAAQNPAIAQASLGTLYNYEFFSNQNTINQTSGVSADATGALTVATAVGSTTVTFNAVTIGGTFQPGDSFSIAGDPQRYVFTALATADGTGLVTAAPVFPAIKQINNIGAVITVFLGGAAKGQNLLFHRNAFALAMAPLTTIGNELGAKIATVQDPVSNLTLRSRMFYDGPNSRTFISIDALWGVSTIDPNLALRLYEP